MNALQIAATGMMAQQYSTEVVANNLANMNTSGYQRRRSEFADLIYSVQERSPTAGSEAGELVPGNVESGHGVRLGSIYRISEQGSLTQTSNTFDLAIQGKGYFQIQLPNGEIGYTRDGSFQLDGSGQIVTENGLPLLPGITVPQGATDVTINPSGEVLVSTDLEGEVVNVGLIVVTERFSSFDFELIENQNAMKKYVKKHIYLNPKFKQQEMVLNEDPRMIYVDEDDNNYYDDDQEDEDEEVNWEESI